MSRWTSADDRFDNMHSTMGMDVYNYVSGNPLKYIDPTGHHKTKSLTNKQWKEFNQSRNRVLKNLKTIEKQLMNSIAKGTKLSSDLVDSAKDLFGVDISCDDVKQTLGKGSLLIYLKTFSNNLKKIKRKNIRTGPSYQIKKEGKVFNVAATVHNGKTMVMRGGFFGKDKKIQDRLLFHEATHLNSQFKTTDHQLDSQKSLELSRKPKYAARNAKNWELFYQSVVQGE